MKFDFNYFLVLCLCGYFSLIIYSMVVPDAHVPSFALGNIAGAFVLALVIPSIAENW